MKIRIYFLAFIILTVFNIGFVFSQTVSNAYLDTSSEKYRNLMSMFNRNAMSNLFNGRDYATENERRNTNTRLPVAIDFYNQKNYEASIDSLINIRKGNPANYGLVYYYLGLCLMDINSLELAKQSFKEAINYFYNRNMVESIDFGMNNLFTYDNNGLKREPYFAYYNIACIESLQNNIELAYEYLCEALFHGYPYINHIRNDSDLQNLFRDRSRLRTIETVYNAGSQNNLIGKYFDLNIPGGYIEYIHFRNVNTLDIYVQHQDGEYYETKTYEIKNYVVFSDTFSYSYYPYNTYVKQFEGLDHFGINFMEITPAVFRQR